MKSLPQPWGDGDILGLCAASAVGLVAIVGAWYGISGSASPASQTGWLNAAMAGVVVSALGNCVWILRGRRAVGERRARLVALHEGESGPDAVPMTSWEDTRTMTVPLMDTDRVRAGGQRRIHSADCPLVAGKNVAPALLGDGAPCGVCAP